MIKVIYRLTASQIVSLLYYKADDIVKQEPVSSEILYEGKRIHSRLGFDEPQQYRRFYFDEKTKGWWLIIGCPDKVDQKNGKVLELKTFQTARISDKVKNVGIVQVNIYCWLTGLLNWELWGYSSYTNKLFKVEEGKFLVDLALQSIEKAIQLKLALLNFHKTYKAIAEGK